MSQNPLDDLDAYQVIRQAGQFKDLLDSPVAGILIRVLEKRYYEELRRASDQGALLLIQAKANVVEDVIHTLRAVISAGERDAFDRAQREQREVERPASPERTE